MKRTLLPAGALLLLLSLTSCSTTAPISTPQRRDLATLKAEQAALTPTQVLESLQRGNARFASWKLEPRDMLHDQQVTAAGQYPHAVILSCMDSRAPAEFVFDQGLGDRFNVRIAGNISDQDLVGSMEYGCVVVGAKLVLVMGHTDCGAKPKAEAAAEILAVIKERWAGTATRVLHEIRPPTIQISFAE
jgi:carbonic anhydrase